MPGTTDADTERATVTTYVPAYQKELWREHAEELDMTQSEFVRTMVQAGRRSFDPSGAAEPPVERPSGENSSNAEEPGSGGSNPRGGLEESVLSLLEREGCLSWDELVEELTDDIERRLDDIMQELQDRNRVRYSGRDGGYTLADS